MVHAYVKENYYARFHTHSYHRCGESSCQLMAKGCALSTGYLPRRGLPRNSVDRLTDHPDMTSAVDRGRKASTQAKNQNRCGETNFNSRLDMNCSLTDKWTDKRTGSKTPTSHPASNRWGSIFSNTGNSKNVYCHNVYSTDCTLYIIQRYNLSFKVAILCISPGLIS